MQIDNQLFDFKQPNYDDIYTRRIKIATRINDMSENEFKAVKQFYAKNPAHFINDFGMTFDPRNVSRGVPAYVPFVLMPKQVQVIETIYEHWINNKDLLIEKSRTVGMSWLAVALACTMCLFNNGFVAGFGSRKEALVDTNNDLSALLPKARMFLKYLPKRFLQGMNLAKDCPFLRLTFANGSQIIGEAGDNIGRGGRTSIYFLDEAAFIERSEKVDAALIGTTNCRIPISTPNGMANTFAQKRFSGKIDVLTYHWRDDLRLDDAWYRQMVINLPPHIIAQEYDINYQASAKWNVIPSQWIQSAIDAHTKLGINAEGIKLGALDVADTGDDKNAFAYRHGIVLHHVEQWSGNDSDIGYTTQHAFKLADDFNVKEFLFDSDGLGSGVRGFARICNESRAYHNQIKVQAFNGSAGVVSPDSREVGDRKNKDFFANRKAQMWWHLRTLFENTHNAICGKAYNKDDIISIASDLPMLGQLILELVQPQYSINTAGKILIDKTPDGVKSPNLADGIMMLYSKRFVDIFAMDNF